MKRVLIYHNAALLKPVGGPSGYLYSLNKGLQTINQNDIEISFLPAESKLDGLRSYSKTTKNDFVKKMVMAHRRIKHIKTCMAILNKQKTAPVDFSQYDAIHFHATRDVYALRDQLKVYKGKVILTSHSPQPLSDEYIEGSSRLELALFGKKYSRLIEMDKYAFTRADNIIFPCEYADEPYYHAWPEYADIKESKKDAYRYMLTGTVPASVKLDRQTVRSKYGIPNDAFVISYAGRHNEIKGYDRLIKICTTALQKYDNIYVIAAGNLGPLYPPEHTRWIEVGWTNDPHSLIAASDVFILPNKETYFDLVLLEVLSLGTIVLASNTGGNRYFANEVGVKLFDTEDTCLALISEIMRMSSDQREALGTGNVNLFKERFTIEQFAQNYLNVLKTII